MDKILKKLNKVIEITNSEEFKKADRMIKDVVKLKDDIKKYCEKQGIFELESDNGKVSYDTRDQIRYDTSLLSDEVKKEIQYTGKTFLSRYEKK